MFTTGTRKILTNEEVEQALLGVLLLHPEHFHRIADKVAPEDFQIPANARIFALIARRVEEGLGVDPLVLAPIADADPDLEPVGGRRYVAELAAQIVSTLSLEDYAEQVRDLAQRRRLLDLAEMIAARVADRVDGGPTEYRPLVPLAEVLAEAQKGLDEVRVDEKRVSAKRRVAAALTESFKRPAACYSTGIWPLDHAMGGGLYAGKCYGFEALDKRGKTTLAGTISHNLNAAGVDHAYIALEMGSAAIEQRNIARELGTNAFAFLKPDDRQFQIRVGRYAAEVPDHTLYVDLPGGSFADVRRVVSSLAAKRLIRGFILDGWQLVRGRERNQAMEEHLRAVAQWCADFGLDHGLFSIITGQLNDDGSGFGSRRGLQMACDQVYKLNRNPNEPHAWLEMLATRYTRPMDVGSEGDPALFFDPHGPHYRAYHPQEQEGFV